MSERSVIIPEMPQVVGSVASLSQLACIQSELLPSVCDILEIRLDGMSSQMNAVMSELDRFREFPLLFTARCKKEGGMLDLEASERADLLLQVANHATWIDVELASCSSMSGAIDEIRNQGVGLVLSHHNFGGTPADREIHQLIERAEEADIVKIAVQHKAVDEILRCAQILMSNKRPMSMMGMGSLAPVSRLLYAQHGSLLNYGYLGEEATAPGQWPAKLLKQAIEKLELIT